MTLIVRRAELSLETKRAASGRLPSSSARACRTGRTLSPWMVVLLLAAVAWRFGVAFRAGATPPRVVRLPLAVGAFFSVLLEHRTLNGVEAGSALLVVMVALKFLESRNQRDQLVLIMISYFLMFASLLGERGPLTAAYIVVLVWVATVALIQIGRRGEFLPYRATGLLSGRLLLHALPVMVALFVLFPRLPGPLWAIPGSTSSGATGLERHDEPRRHHEPRAFGRGRVPRRVRGPSAARQRSVLARPVADPLQRQNVVDATGRAPRRARRWRRSNTAASPRAIA